MSEVILSLQHASVPFRTYHAGMLAEVFHDHPIITEQPPLDPAFEIFGAPPSVHQGIFRSVQMGFLPLVPRYWFQTLDRTEVLQFQPDRFSQNWVQQSGAIAYPRFEPLAARFEDHIARLDSFLAKRELGEILPNQCEITYVNAITLPDGRDPRVELGDIFRVWSNDYAAEQGRTIEDASIRYRYVLTDPSGAPYARLHAAIEPISRVSDGSPAVQFTLMVRGRPQVPTVASALEFLSDGRDAIVRAFASMTRPAMHALWGRKDAR